MKTYAVRINQKMPDGSWREHGELIPEAHTWWRLESWLHTGQIEEVDVRESVFRKAIAQYCPELEVQILEQAGMPLVVTVGKTPRKVEIPARSPRRRSTVQDGEYLDQGTGRRSAEG